MEEFGIKYHNRITASVEAEQARLKERLDKNDQSCASIQDSLNAIITAEARHNASIDKVIVSDDDDEAFIDATDINAVENNPTEEDKTRFLTLVSEGKVQNDILKEVHGLNKRLEETKKINDDLLINLNKLDNILKEIKKDIINIKQYLKIENLLFHNFYLPPNYKQMSSLQFSYFMAQQINYLIPQLDCPLTMDHISTAHPLKTKRKNSNVIVVRFSNRFMRDEIFSKKHFISKRYAVTEHLTEENLNIFKKAKSVFGYNNVSTVNCNVFVNVNGVRRFVKSIEHVNELLESIHADDQSVHNTFTNNTNPKNNRYTDAGRPAASHSQRGHGRSNRGGYVRRGHYSVRNRQY